jgi:hypothetical protein
MVPVMMSSAADHHRRSGFLVWLGRLLPGFYPPVADCWCRRGVCNHKHTRRVAHRVGRLAGDERSRFLLVARLERSSPPPPKSLPLRPEPQSPASSGPQVRQAAKAPAVTSTPGPAPNPTRTRATTPTATTSTSCRRLLGRFEASGFEHVRPPGSSLRQRLRRKQPRSPAGVVLGHGGSAA